MTCGWRRDRQKRFSRGWRNGNGFGREEKPTDSLAFKIGQFQCLAVSDGTIVVPDMVTPKKFDPADPGSGLAMDVNCLVIDTGGHRILVDTGCGAGFGPASGKLLANLQAAGIGASKIDTVVLTHAHSDHVGANVNAQGKPAFPNARYVIHRAEWQYWMGRLRAEADNPRSMLGIVGRNLPPIKERVEFVEDGEAVAPGIECILTPGHTPGELMLMVTSGKDRLFCAADLMHHEAELSRPDVFAIFDVNHDESVAARHRTLSRLVDSGVLVFLCHLDFPGLGHFVKKGKEIVWQRGDVRR